MKKENTEKKIQNTIHNTLYAKRYTLYAILIALTCLILPQAAQAATTYYVAAEDPNASDTNPGTGGQPWQTMARAMQNWNGAGSKVQKGDTVYLRSGNYGDVYFSFDPTSVSNYPANWDEKILYKNDVGQTPVFTWLGFGYRKPRYLEFDGINITRPEEAINSGKECIYERGASSLHFKNMKLTGYWETETATAKGKMTATGIAISTPDWSVVRDILIENCEITQVQRGIQVSQCIIGTGIIVRNNTIHHTSNSGVLVDRMVPTDPNNGTITIEGNNIYDEESVLSYHRITYDVAKKTGTFVNNDLCIQDVTGAEGLYYNYDSGIAFISPTQLTPAWEAGVGKNILCGKDGVIADPLEITHTDYSHASGLAITADKVIIRGNTIRSFGGSYPIGLYADDTKFPNGFTDLLIENNVIYDSVEQHPVTLDSLGGSEGVDANIIIRNNTLIGKHVNSSNGYYFNGGLTVLPKLGKTGNGVKIYGNVIAGILTLNDKDSSGNIYTLTDYEENYNIIYSAITLGTGLPVGRSDFTSFLKGNHTIIYSNGSNQPTGDFESGFFADPDYYGHGTNYIHYPADGGPSNTISDYSLVESSPAINFVADLAYAPSTDILGNLRDSQPDAGCYEYGAAAFLYGDVSGEGEVTAYDAALTAQAAVELITLTPEQTKAADVSGEGEVTAYDAALIAQKAVKLIDKFPVEE